MTYAKLNRKQAEHVRAWICSHFATLEEALADAKRTIDLDIETECPSCDEIHVINDEGETVNRWLWCPDDIGAPFSWHEN